MSRSGERWGLVARQMAKRFVTRAKRALFTDPGKDSGDVVERAGALELARTAGEHKGGLAKVAQLMAYQVGPGAAADKDARRALGQLWDRAPAQSAEAIRGVVEADLGKSISELFSSWDDTPMAAASLGQVHGAVTTDGVHVAVKVQYPGIAEALRSDLESPRILKQLAGADVGGALDEAAVAVLRDAVLGELDYQAEARWLERFRRAFVGEKSMVVPRLHPTLSGQRVLTAERLDGRTLAEAAWGDAHTALTIFRFAWRAPIEHRLLNADPNPGNYLVLDGGRVGFIDFGCATEIDDELATSDRKLWHAILDGDGEMLRFRVHEEGLVSRAQARVLDSTTYRDWELHLAAPFLHRRPFNWTAGYARGLAALTSQLVRAGGMSLPPKALLLWRQRLGVAAVIGSLGATADFRQALEDVLR
jgi:predicted unusual protein kinase regulating ubiquinone biosynthesis (AarF/ABC1/UbiB family)